MDWTLEMHSSFSQFWHGKQVNSGAHIFLIYSDSKIVKRKKIFLGKSYIIVIIIIYYKHHYNEMAIKGPHFDKQQHCPSYLVDKLSDLSGM